MKVDVHPPQVGVCMAMHRVSMHVEPEQLSCHDEHTDIAHGTEVHKLSYLVLKETLVDQKHIEPLQERGSVGTAFN